MKREYAPWLSKLQREVLMYYPRSDWDSNMEELHQEDLARKRYLGRLAAHPDPRDPDFPGDDADDE